ncbi:alanine racemase [Hirschia litorea]|uniref:Alanine racemase n=1 Tax=Hirschia litorea TaxID=1199156 RepID=A0ABW2IGR9_9PROT
MTNALHNSTDSNSMISSSSPSSTIHLQNIVANWHTLAKLSGSAETGVVVKANAYGLGATKIAQALYEAGCRTFFTAHTNEATEIRKAVGPLALVFLFHGLQQDNVDIVISQDIVPVLNSLEQLKLWQKANAPFPAALHIDTGMNRLGLQIKDIADAKDILPEGRIGWVMSHLACADTPEHPMNARQLELFKKVAAVWPQAQKSLCNSAGICLGKDFTFDLTRPGIGLYGGYSRANVFTPKHAITLTAPLLNIFSPEHFEDATIGYGATLPVKPNQRLGTVALGYADGMLRSLSNYGFGYIKGVRCPIVGRVSMDLITLDITNAPSDTSILDRVEFLGQHANIEEQARAGVTASYELLTCLGTRIPRVYEQPEQSS